MLSPTTLTRRYWPAIAIAATTLLLFFQAGGFTFLTYDDPHYVKANPAVAMDWIDAIKYSFTETGILNLWHPLTTLSFVVEAKIFGSDSAASYHWTNLILHSINGALIFVFLRQNGIAPSLSTSLALIWLLHPLRLESYAWVSGRKDLLCCMFFLASMIAFKHFILFSKVGTYRLSVIFFILCCLSKPTAVAFPALAYLWVHLTSGKNLSLSAKLGATLPFAITSTLTVAVTLISHSQGGLSASDSTLLQRVVFIPYSFCYALFSGAAPFWHDEFFTSREPLGTSFFPVMSWLAMMAIAASLYLKRTRIPTLTLLGLSLFTLTWLPISGLVDIGPYFIADRYTYIPHIGILIAVAPFLKTSKVSLGIQSLIIALLATLSLTRLPIWKNEKSFFTNEVERNPTSLMAHVHLGNQFLRENNNEQAESNYLRALEISPNSGIALTNYGLFLEKQGDFTSASASYQKAIKQRLNYPTAYIRLAAIHASQNQEQACHQILQLGLSQFPRSSYLWSGVGYHLLRTEGTSKNAKAAFARALELNPANQDARSGLQLGLTENK